MNIETFNKLLLEEKAGVIQREGKFIDERAIYNKSYIKLYQVNEFFAEVFMDVKAASKFMPTPPVASAVCKPHLATKSIYNAKKKHP